MVFERRTGKTDTHSNSKPAGGISGIEVLEVVRLSGSGINKVNSACCDLQGNHDKNRAYNFQGGRGIKKRNDKINQDQVMPRREIKTNTEEPRQKGITKEVTDVNVDVLVVTLDVNFPNVSFQQRFKTV